MKSHRTKDDKQFVADDLFVCQHSNKPVLPAAIVEKPQTSPCRLRNVICCLEKQLVVPF